jgi:hypothetical protein
MNNTLMKILVVLVLFCGTVLAEDGNMGTSGYTGCGGTNPSPNCSCSQQDPPPNCSGFANVNRTEDASVVYTTTVIDEVVEVVLPLV